MNVFLIRWFIAKRAPLMLNDARWEIAAGTGMVPRWVSEVGLAGTAFIAAGIAIAILVLLGVVFRSLSS